MNAILPRMGGNGRGRSTFFTPYVSNGSAEANYSPLPSFTVFSSEAKKHIAPTLSTVATQIGTILSKVLAISDSLKAQLDFEKFEYKEKARIQREINAESNKVSSGALADFGSLALLDILNKLNKSLDKIPDGDPEDPSSGLGSLMAFFGFGKKGKHNRRPPGGNQTRTFDNSRFVKKAEALDTNGKLKPGYEAVKGTNGSIVGYRAAVAAEAASPGLISKAVNGIKGLAGNVKIGPKGLSIAAMAYMSYEAWNEIQALSPDLSPSARRNRITAIVSKLVAATGVFWAGSILGTMMGSAVAPGLGTVGGLVAGMVGGTIATMAIGNDVDEIVETLVNMAIPVESASAQPTAMETPVTPQVTQSMPAAKTPIASVLSKAAAAVGIEAPILFSIANSDTPGINFTSDISSIKTDIFNISNDQWNEVTAKYSAQFPELRTQRSSPATQATAAALLVKDSQTFLQEHNLQQSHSAVQSTYNIGTSNMSTIMQADSNTPISSLTSGLSAKGQQTVAGSSTTGDFIQNTFSTIEESEKAIPVNEGTAPVTNITNESFSLPSMTPTTSAAPITEDTAPTIGASPLEPAPIVGESIDRASREVDDIESGISVTHIDATSSGGGTSVIGGSGGSEGTGNVPNPNFDLGFIKEQLFFGVHA